MSPLVRIGGGAAAVLALVLAVLVTQPRTGPRLGLVSSNPADRAALARAPADIELTFTTAVDPDLSHVSVSDAAGTGLTAGRPQLAAPDRLRQRVHIAGAGEVTVAYHVISVDGAEAAGSLRFTARAGAPPTASARAGVAGAEHQHGIDPLSAALLVLDGLVALGAAALLMVRRAPGGRDDRRLWSRVRESFGRCHTT